MTTENPREIPYNYTSADDRQMVSSLLGAEVWDKLEQLRSQRVTGRSARLLMRFFGDVLIHRRNPFLFQELLDSPRRRRRLMRSLASTLQIIDHNARGQTVVEVLDECRRALDELRRDVAGTPDRRRRMRRVLGAVVGRDNVLFDPITLVAHATDATDWRLHLPIAVVMPTAEEQVAPLLRAIGQLGLHAIPRGAGTGLTGGAVPLRPNCVVVNTERLNRIHGIEERELPRDDGQPALRAPVLRLEAGVITEHAIEHAAERGLVFATDPTSAWACTIGGNIAENAGGKTGVLWGTAIDNLISYTMAMPDGARWRIKRIGHPLRKILPADTVRFDVEDENGAVVRRIALGAHEIRKKGLWKDVTNKALGGLPGVQKEGTDGVITSAEFVLYSDFAASSTVCLEFFGPDMDEASRAIQEIVAAFPGPGGEVLRALEHFDDEYVRAIEYRVKAPRREVPKAVLLIDVVGDSPVHTERGVATIRRILSRHGNTCLFQAKNDAEAKLFWQDRKRLGAIAARTNAFKLNEDIVLPHVSLAEFARFCDAQNAEEERYAQARFVDRVEEVLSAAQISEDPIWFTEKVPAARALCEATRRALAPTVMAGRSLRGGTVAAELRDALLELMRGYADVAAAIRAVYDEVRTRLLVIATHMHAGDGNVHVNIPILSNDRAMMRRADELVDRVMERVMALGGVPTGEHGVGVTKLKYLEPERIAELDAYRAVVDPAGIMNPGKLSDRTVLDRVFTPSFNLLELEARILQHGQLEALANKIAQCVRCGKCKTSCCMFHPARGLFFHPRNKNLAIGALVEALIYDAQSERSTSFELLRHLEEVADHCTVCHKCAKQCPTKIDTGQVSVLEREILAARKFKHTAPLTRAVLSFLDSRSPLFNKLFRAGVLGLGATLQRAGVRLAAPLQSVAPAARLYPIRLLRSPMARPDGESLRELLPPCDADQVLVLEPEGEPARKTVFYFPGCGSERIYSRVSMASIYLLLQSGARVVLPPPYLCCGYPAYVNAKGAQHGRTILRDTIIFTQIRSMFSHLDFDACVVSCGTCREALVAMEAGKVFGCGVVDVARFLDGLGLRVAGEAGRLYHPPCHDSLDGAAPAVIERLTGRKPDVVPHCCAEGGTLALSRPDIAGAMGDRKAEAIAQAIEEHRAPGAPGPLGAPSPSADVVILTNCPSCLQGLGRHGERGVVPRHVAVELADRMAPGRWVDELRRLVTRAEVVRF